MLSFTLYLHFEQEARLFVLLVLFNVFCVVSQKKKNVNMIDSNIPITKHIIK